MNTSMAITLVCHGSYRVTFLLTGGVHGVTECLYTTNRTLHSPTVCWTR